MKFLKVLALLSIVTIFTACAHKEESTSNENSNNQNLKLSKATRIHERYVDRFVK